MSEQDNIFRGSDPSGSGPLFFFNGIPVRATLPASWVASVVNCKEMMKELERRPHSKFPEMEELMHPNTPYCRCDDCYRQRRELLQDLTLINCENR